MNFDLSQVELSRNDLKRDLVLPKNPSKELAEFIGILAGDGHISFNTKKNQVRITGNSVSDYEYFHEYVTKLILTLFDINVKIRKRRGKNAIDICFSSKGFVLFMKSMGYYKHTKDIRIPGWIMGKEEYSNSFVRGLIDTDGCVFVSDKKGSPKYPCVELTTISLNLAKGVKDYLQRKNFRVAGIRAYYYAHSGNASYKVSIYGQLNLSKWIKEIGFSNQYKADRAISYQR